MAVAAAAMTAAGVTPSAPIFAFFLSRASLERTAAGLSLRCRLQGVDEEEEEEDVEGGARGTALAGGGDTEQGRMSDAAQKGKCTACE